MRIATLFSRRAAFGFGLGLAVLAFGCQVRAATITVFAAASLNECLNKIGAEYEKESHDKVQFSFAGSSVLERQIEEGAPADIFFSADEELMDRLQKKGLIQTNTRKSRLSNSLVVVVPSDSSLVISSPRDLAGPAVHRVALADPKSVPAGVYAREYLQKENLWATIEPKVVPTANVRGALAAVESGDVEAAMVYKTDASISKKVKIACEISRQDGPRISYPAALLKDAPAPVSAKNFLEYLDSPEAAKVFSEAGFIVLKATP